VGPGVREVPMVPTGTGVVTMVGGDVGVGVIGGVSAHPAQIAITTSAQNSTNR
jgi:hypothetical protein